MSMSPIEELNLVQEINDDKEEIQKDFETINVANEALRSLNNLDANHRVLEDKPELVTPDIVAVSNETLRLNAELLGLSLEELSLSNEDSETPTLSTEGLANMIAKVLEAILNIIKRIVSEIKKLYVKIRIQYDNSAARAKEVYEKLSALPETKEPMPFGKEDLIKVIGNVGAIGLINNLNFNDEFCSKLNTNFKGIVDTTPLLQEMFDYISIAMYSAPKFDDIWKYLSGEENNFNTKLVETWEAFSRKTWNDAIEKHPQYFQLATNFKKAAADGYIKFSNKQVEEVVTGYPGVQMPYRFKGAILYASVLGTSTAPFLSFTFMVNYNKVKKNNVIEVPKLSTLLSLTKTVSESSATMEEVNKKVNDTLDDIKKQAKDFYKDYEKNVQTDRTQTQQIVYRNYYSVAQSRLTSIGLNTVLGTLEVMQGIITYIDLCASKYE